MKGIARDYLPAIAFTPKKMEERKGKVDKENQRGKKVCQGESKRVKERSPKRIKEGKGKVTKEKKG